MVIEMAMRGGMKTAYHRRMLIDTPVELSELLQAADTAAPSERVNLWRDPIAAHGTDAVAAMSEWLKEGRHTGFAIRTLERVAEADDPVLADHAVRVLRRMQPQLGKSDKDLIEGTYKRLGLPKRPTKPAPDPRLYERLIESARSRTMLSYSEVGTPAELDMSLSYHRRLIGQMLGEISIRESRAGRPMLSSIVVHEGSITVGSGFYQLGQDMQQVQPDESDKDFAKRQQQETFEFWSTHPEAGPLE